MNKPQASGFTWIKSEINKDLNATFKGHLIPMGIKFKCIKCLIRALNVIRTIYVRISLPHWLSTQSRSATNFVQQNFRRYQKKTKSRASCLTRSYLCPTDKSREKSINRNSQLNPRYRELLSKTWYTLTLLKSIPKSSKPP